MADTLLRLDLARSYLKKGKGKGVRIAILDSGVEISHPSLEGIELLDDIAIAEKGHRLHIHDGGGQDRYGHGTAIAYIIHKIAPEAEIGSIRVLGERLNSRTAIIHEGVRQAFDRGYHILNCSFGCGIEEHVLKYKAWIDEAYLRGVHVVAACNNFDFSKQEWPGYFPTVLTVNFCRGRMEDNIENRFYHRSGHLVEFAMPSEEIHVPWLGGAYKKVTGSSYATPQIAGLLSRLLSKSPILSPLEAKSLMQHLATPWNYW